MLSYLGNFALWLSLFFALVQLINSNRNKNISIIKYNKTAVYGLLFSSLFSFLSLTYSHIISDFSLLNVFQNSHTTKPFIYKIAGVWGNHEGSMLLWIIVLTLFNYFIFKLYNIKNYNFV